MSIITRAILLRILLIISFVLMYYGILVNQEQTIPYSALFFIALILLLIEQKSHERRNNGRINFFGNIIPDLAPNDEREKQLNGEAYKIAFSTVLVISVVVTAAVASLLLIEAISPLAIMLCIAFIPVSGLIAFMLTYKKMY